MTARTRTDILLLAGFCTFLFFYGLGQFGLIGADEPRYAQVAREMLDRHDWITPTLNGRPWLEKPPLYYWQAMIAFRIFGVTDVAARLPSAFDASFMVIAVYLFFRKFRHGSEVDAALISASCAGFIGYARAASMDMPLTAAFSAAMLAWWAWHERAGHNYLALFYFFIALATLAKGPVAPFLAAVVIIAFAAAARDWRLIFRTLWIPGILVFAAVALPWYVAVQIRNPSFFREFILEHNLARFSTNLYHHPEPIWYYVPVLALALVPWIVFVTAALLDSVRILWTERHAAAETDLQLQFRTFAGIWLIAPLIFFSASQSKLPGYILPAVPAAGVLLADYLLHRSEHNESVPKWLAFLHALVACAPIVPAALIGYIVMEHQLPAGRPLYVALIVSVLLCVAIALTLLSRLHFRMLRFLTLIPVVLSVAAVLKLGSAAIDQKLSTRPLATELASFETHKLPVAVCGAQREIEYGLAFYRNQNILRYETDGPPSEEHLVVAPTNWADNVVRYSAGRRIAHLGHYASQDLDFFWVAAAAAKR